MDNRLKQTSEDEKKCNAFLRERFLYEVSNLCGKKDSRIRMYENTEVTGNVKAFDLNFENMIVENLKTPLPDPIKFAVLRTNDVLTISYK